MFSEMSFCVRGFLFVLHIFFWLVVVFGILTLIKYVVQPGQKQKDEALETLRRRYAAGEINREEFEGKRKDLLRKE